MKPSVYIETTIPSFIVGSVSPILATAAHQIVTRRWWEEEREKYRLFVSRVVEDEISQGTMRLAQLRMLLLEGLQRLAVIVISWILQKNSTPIYGFLRPPRRMRCIWRLQAITKSTTC